MSHPSIYRHDFLGMCPGRSVLRLGFARVAPRLGDSASPEHPAAIGVRTGHSGARAVCARCIARLGRSPGDYRNFVTNGVYARDARSWRPRLPAQVRWPVSRQPIPRCEEPLSYAVCMRGEFIRSHHLALVALWLSLQVPARGAEKDKAPEPPLSVQLVGAAGLSFRGLDRVEVSVRDGTGKETWRCVLADGQRRALKEFPCPRTGGWMSEGRETTYDVFVSAWRHGERRPVAVGQKLSVSGDELRIQVKLWFQPVEPCGGGIERPLGKGIPMSLATFTLERTLPAPTELVLKRAWTPLAAGMLKYKIENHGKLDWFGTGNLVNFFGRVEIFQNGRWTPYLRGGMCGTDDGGSALTPGTETESIEGSYMGSPRPFEPGRYRYVVALAREIHLEGYPCAFAAAGAPLLQSVNFYELSDEFSIAP